MTPDKTKQEMTPEEFSKKWGIRELFSEECGQWEYTYNSMECLSDLRSVIRGETSELLKQRDELLQQVNNLKELLKEVYAKAVEEITKASER